VSNLIFVAVTAATATAITTTTATTITTKINNTFYVYCHAN